MKSQNDVLLYRKDEQLIQPENDKIMEVNYKSAERKFNIRLFFTKTLRDIIQDVGYVLMSFSRRNRKLNLKNTSIFSANDGLHLVTTGVRKGLYGKHIHYVDVITGSEFCTNQLYAGCKKIVPYNDQKSMVVGSPINYMTSEEYVAMNTNTISYEEKVEIVYNILNRAKEKLDKDGEVQKTK